MLFYFIDEIYTKILLHTTKIKLLKKNYIQNLLKLSNSALGSLELRRDWHV